MSIAPFPGSSPEPCPRCRGTQVLFTPQGERSMVTLCECAARCEQCGGTGRLIRSDNGTLFAELCVCRGRQRRVELYNRANIPRHFCGRGFESFRTYEAPMRDVLNKMQSFARDYPRITKKGVLLYGPPGTGKTHLLCGALQHLTLERGIRARYVEFSFLVSEIKEAFMRNVSALVALAPLAEVEILAIDELAKGRATEFEREVLDELVSRRYNADKTTLFATNFNAKPRQPEPESSGTGDYTDMKKKVEQLKDDEKLGLSDELKDKVGSRTFSRLAEMVEAILMPAQTKDRRFPQSA